MIEKHGHIEVGVGDRIISSKGEAIITNPTHPPQVTKIIKHAGREALHPMSGSSLLPGEPIVKTKETWPPEKVSQALIDGHEAIGWPRDAQQQEEIHQSIRDNHAKGTTWVLGNRQS